MSNELWVYISTSSGRTDALSSALLGRAQQMAAESGMALAAVLIGEGVMPEANALAQLGVPTVYAADIPGLVACEALRITNVLETLVKEKQPDIFLFPATDSASTVASCLGIRLQTGVNVHCVTAEIRDGIFIGSVPAFGGRVMSEILCPVKRPQMATVRLSSGAFSPAAPGQVLCFAEAAPEVDGMKLLSVEVPEKSGPDLGKAPLVLCAGAGIADSETYHALTDLAGELGAAVCCTRDALEMDIGASEQQMVGVSGTTVSPKVYLGFGVSGAAHHIFGMKDSKLILNVNHDADCPFFKGSDYGYVGEADEVICALQKEIASRRG